MKTYQECLRTMEELFAHDCQFALATSRENIPSVRCVDMLYDDGAFFVVTYAASQKIREISDNPNVSFCRDMYRFSGKAQNIGHPLRPENAAIREKLTEAFKTWYFRHNDEGDADMCYVKIILANGFFHKDGTGWAVDFSARTVRTFPFHPDILPAE
ncbi:MAG: pyridoxamine 5'-phosphate oxidase family protein [Clostridiaceae bacterium]|nr:pyridoxamine 5'-phosphate oxidase family protein [Clostridiaceae bacterium]